MSTRPLTRRAFAAGALSAGLAPALLGPARASSREQVAIAMLANLDAGPVLLAKERGFFEKHGLDATVHTGGSGATIIPTVLSGQFPIGYANVVSDLQAIDRGLPLLLVHPAYGHPSDPARDSYRVYVRPDGPIREVAQLARANIGSVSVNNIAEWTTRRSLDNLGVRDHSRLRWTRVGTDDGVTAVRNGQLDAIWLSQPAGARAVRAGLVPILSANANSIPGAVGGYYITSRRFAAASPSIVGKYKAAIAEANDFASENPGAVRAIIVEKLGFDRESVEASELNLYPNDPNLASLRAIAEDLVRYGLIRRLPDFDAIFWRPAA